MALGGGVVGDLAGFVAATYARGVPFVQVPTTLLAQVDSSVGGKVGINHARGKNLIGAFHPPAMVAIDPELLATLPRREFRAGLYEVIKYGMTSSPPLFERIARDRQAIFARTPEVLAAVITESCRIKADVVAKDDVLLAERLPEREARLVGVSDATRPVRTGRPWSRRWRPRSPA